MKDLRIDVNKLVDEKIGGRHLLEYDDLLGDEEREKTGSYYTPEYISDFMIKSTIIKYIKNKYKEKSESFDVILNNYRDEIIDLKLVDLSCGTGVFLRRYYYLLDERLSLKNDEKEKLASNIYGFDIQREPLEILGRYFYDINGINLKNLIHVDTLNTEVFYDLIDGEKFDIVIGNPPYLGEKGNKDIFDKIKSDEICSKYYEGKMDLFYFFIYRGIDVLKEDGILTYITTNYFITADGAKNLRKFLRDNTDFIQVFNFNDHKLFKSAIGQHNMIYSLGKKKMWNMGCDVISIKDIKIKIDIIEELLNSYGQDDNWDKNDRINYYMTDSDNLFSDNNICLYQKGQYKGIIDKILDSSEYKISDYYQVNQGIVSGADYVTKNIYEKKLSLEDRKNTVLGQGIFVVKDENLYKFSERDKKYIRKFYKNSDILRYDTSLDSCKNIIYIDRSFDPENQDNIIEHLTPFKEMLSKRREVRNGVREWYHLQWYRDSDIFEREKIVCPQRSRINKFAYNSCDWYGSADIYYISKKFDLDDSYDLKTLCLILNSKLYYFWLYNRGKRKGRDLELYSTPIKEIPVIKISNEGLKVLEELIKDGFEKVDRTLVDSILYNEIGLNRHEIHEVESLFTMIE
ncbi:MAG: N-6 DNA methylase [Firmicutes bacterium]|nr:N-6 DNA methylase [Bacillota bacterium]